MRKSDARRPAQAPAKPQDRVSLRAIAGFGAGSLGTGIYSSVPSVLLLFFMTDTLGIAPGLASLAVFLPKIWDVVTDPVMGLISDRTRSRWGRRRPYLLAGALLMTVTFIFLFSVPDFETPRESFFYVLIVFTLSATAYTIYAVPYIAMPAEMSADHHQRTIIMSYRMTFAMAGILLGSALAPYVVAWAGGGRDGYAAMSYVVGGICAASMLTAFFATRDVPSTMPGAGTTPPLAAQFRMLVRNRPFQILLAIYVTQLTAMGTFTAGIPYFAIHVLHRDTALIGTIFLVFLGTAILTMAVWTFGAKLMGKRASFMVASLVYGLGTLSLFLTPAEGDLTFFWLQMAILGFGFAGMQMLPFSMLTDAIRLDNLRTRVFREGVFTGIWTASEKLGLAVGPLIAGLVLGASGFRESTAEAIAAQPASAIEGIRMLIALIPALSIIASIALIRIYPITENFLVAEERAFAHADRA